MNDNFAEMFWIAIVIAAILGWAVIEGLIWVVSHISFGWI